MIEALAAAAFLLGVTPGDPPEATPDEATVRLGQILKFVRDHEKDTGLWRQREDEGQICHVDLASKAVDVTFRADGVMHCRLDELAEGFEVRVHILTLRRYAKTAPDGQSHYLVTAQPGQALSDLVPIRGAADDVKAALAAVRWALVAADEAPAWDDWGEVGPFHAVDVSIKVDLKEAGVEHATTLAVTRLFALNLGFVAVGGPGTATYAVKAQAISADRPVFQPNFYFGVQWYPFSWNRNGNKKLASGRYFSARYEAWYDRLAIVAGISLDHPTESLFLGLSCELLRGVSLVAGWQPRLVQRLTAGHSVGERIDGEVPIDHVWQFANWGVGLEIDASIAKSVLSTFQK